MKISPRSSRKRSKLKVWEIIVGGGIATTIVFPIYWMIITGLRPQTETFSSTPKLIPTIKKYLKRVLCCKVFGIQ